MSSADTDDIFDLIETHRAAYALLGKAEVDFNAAADGDDALEGALLTACRIGSSADCTTPCSPLGPARLRGWWR
jgi:hypothetical protein